MYMLHLLRQAGHVVLGFERGDDVGGTWYWNRYPWCRCDVESMEYSYQFDAHLEQTWDWQERWVETVNQRAAPTFYPRCNSWYLGANIPGKARVFMPYLGFPAYAEKLRDVIADDYAGFVKQA